MAQESAPTEIVRAERSNPDPIDLEARLSGDRGNDHRGEMDFLSSLYQAAVTGDGDLLRTLLDGNVDRRQLLLSPFDDEGNTCLHIAVMAKEYRLFMKLALSYEPELLSVRNGRGLTPLSLVAVSNTELLSGFTIYIPRNVPESEIHSVIMDTDDNGDTAAHHALRNGHTTLAFQMIHLAPEIATLVNKRSESLMYMACWGGRTHVFWQLLRISRSARDAPVGKSVLTAAVLAGKTEIAGELLKDGTTTIPDHDHFEALIYAIRGHQLEIVKMLLSQNKELGLRRQSAFSCAAEEGNVSIGEMIIKLCYFPAALLSDSRGRSALHIAVEKGHIEFVKFILRIYELGRLINQADDSGQTPLHLAAEHCRPRIVSALLAHIKKRQVRQHFAVNNNGFTALDIAYFKARDQMSGFKWSEVVTLLSDASCPLTAPYEVREKAKQNFIDNIREHANSVTGAYRQSTSTVGILITTVTFAAAFTLPGGYISDKGPIEGLPVLARKAAFQAFLISDTLAMCAFVMAAFICNMYRLSDLDFVLYYAKKIGYLMWFSYSTMAIAFATGLYTVLAPTNLWLSIFVCVLCGFIPPLSYFFVEWPVLKLDHQVHGVLKIKLKETL